MTQTNEDVIENAEIDQPGDEVDIDADNPDGALGEVDAPPEGGADTLEGGTAAESFDLTIEGFENDPEPEEPKAGANWVNDLRKRERKLAKENRELKQRLEAGGTKDERAIVVGEKPTFESCEFDDARFERDLLAWTERKAKYEQQQTEKQQAEEQAQRSFQEKLAKYDAERKAMPVDDYDDAEEAVQAALNQVQLGILIKNAPERAKMVYALGKNEKALQHLATIKDPDTYAVELGRIIERMKSTPSPKKPIPSPERVVRGSGGSSQAGTAANLEKLKEEARKTGDYTAYYAAKNKAG